MSEELGNGWTAGVHADDRDQCLRTFGNAFAAHEPFVIQCRMRRLEMRGNIAGSPANGVPPLRNPARKKPVSAYIGACVDVTDLLEKERALHVIEERVTLAAEAAHLGVWELETTTNALWLSAEARELFQFGAVPVSYARFQEHVHPEDRAMREAAVQRAIDSLGGYEIEYRMLLPNGTMRWIASRGRMLSDEPGKPPRLLGVSMDITERKAAEEEARLRREQIHLLSRVSVLGEMTASLTHELGQPLAAILSNASAGVRFIDSDSGDSGLFREILVDVIAATRRARDIIDDVRNAIKKGDTIRGRINLNDVVTSVTHIVQPEAAARACEIQITLVKISRRSKATRTRSNRSSSIS